MFSRKLEFFALAVLALAGSSALAAEVGSGRFYCCVDPNTNKRICGDILPPPCYGRAYRELGSDGRTIREVAAPLTAEQIAQKAAEENERRQAAIAQKEQQRRDQILLDTYSSADEIDALRNRALEEARQAVSKAIERIDEIKTHRKKIEAEAEFYKSGAVPPEIQKGLADTAFEIKTQEAIIEARRKEIVSLQAKFDEDRKHFLELQERQAKRVGQK